MISEYHLKSLFHSSPSYHVVLEEGVFWNIFDKKAYAKRIVIVAFIAQIPYMYLNRDFEINYYGYNVLFLFVYALGMLQVFDKMIKANRQVQNIKFQLYLVLLGFLIILPELFRIWIPGFFLSYGTYGLVLILLFYIFHEKSLWLLLIYPVFSLIFAYLDAVLYVTQWLDIPYVSTLFNIPQMLNILFGQQSSILDVSGFFFQSRSILGLFAVLGLASFAYRLHLPRYFLYVFYPAHIIVLVLFKIIVT